MPTQATPRPDARRIVHVDMDAFFAAVELLRRPELKGKPVVIGGRGDPRQRGVVSTASYEARRYGIHSALPLRVAHRLCPQAVFLPVDYAEYARVSAVIKAVLREVSPILEDAGIDEAFLDVSHLDATPEEVAATIKVRIREATGLTCSIGIAPNKLLAKIASDLQKPDGLTVLEEKDVPERVWPLAVRKVPGIGPKTEERLKELGVIIVGDLARVPLEALIARFGPAHGGFLYRAARGQDGSPVITHWEPKSRSREVTFQRDTADWQAIARTLAGLAKRVAGDLQEEGLKARLVGIKLRFSDFKACTRDKTLDAATDASERIRRAAFECLSRVELNRPVRLVGVRVGELIRR